MLIFIDDNRLKSIVEEEPTSEEEIDTWDWFLIASLWRHVSSMMAPQLRYMGFLNLACHVFGLKLD
jgi:hypothetical protein